jgi:hypothetical protein
MSGRARTEAAARRHARAILAQLPFPTEVARIKAQVRRASGLSCAERFRAQLALLRLAEPDPKARAAAKRWHDRQDAIEAQRFRELF